MGSQLRKEEKATFYEKGLRPAIESYLPQDISDWPSTYESEVFRAKRKTGQLAYGTKVVPRWVVPNLADAIRDNLTDAEIPWGGSMFILHTIRGTKSATRHACEADDARLALGEYLTDADIPEAATTSGTWWIDVGMEIMTEYLECLQWRTSSHFHITRAVLGISEAHASRITKIGSSKYSRDMASHLTAVSGCRIEPGSQAEGEYRAIYLQMYTTDKALTYSPEGRNHGKAITMAAAMGPTQPPNFISGLFDLYSSASENSPSNARVEVRVPIEHATSVFLNIGGDLLRDSLLSFTTEEWWSVFPFTHTLDQRSPASLAGTFGYFG